MTEDILIATHYGIVRFGDITCEAVVLKTGERGYVRRQLAKLLGFHETHKGSRFAQFLAEMAPNCLNKIEKKGWPIALPSGQRARFFPAGVITEIAAGVVDAALKGQLHKARLGIVPNCMVILRTLAVTGEVALIDEATGFQYRRAPDALQDLLAQLLRQSCATWERRFQPEYYQALYRLFGWEYRGHVQNPPHIIGQITLKWIYAVVFPVELIEAIKARKDLGERCHQWLTEGGLLVLERQINAVTMLARGAYSFQDFEARCAAAFRQAPVQIGLEV